MSCVEVLEVVNKLKVIRVTCESLSHLTGMCFHRCEQLLKCLEIDEKIAL